MGPLQTDPLSGKISNKSPLGKVLLGKKVGQFVEYKSETGRDFKVEILEVK